MELIEVYFKRTRGNRTFINVCTFNNENVCNEWSGQSVNLESRPRKTLEYENLKVAVSDHWGDMERNGFVFEKAHYKKNGRIEEIISEAGNLSELHTMCNTMLASGVHNPSDDYDPEFVQILEDEINDLSPTKYNVPRGKKFMWSSRVRTGRHTNTIFRYKNTDVLTANRDEFRISRDADHKFHLHEIIPLSANYAFYNHARVMRIADIEKFEQSQYYYGQDDKMLKANELGEFILVDGHYATQNRNGVDVKEARIVYALSRDGGMYVIAFKAFDNKLSEIFEEVNADPMVARGAHVTFNAESETNFGVIPPFCHNHVGVVTKVIGNGAFQAEVRCECGLVYGATNSNLINAEQANRSKSCDDCLKFHNKDCHAAWCVPDNEECYREKEDLVQEIIEAPNNEYGVGNHYHNNYHGIVTDNGFVKVTIGEKSTIGNKTDHSIRDMIRDLVEKWSETPEKIAKSLNIKEVEKGTLLEKDKRGELVIPEENENWDNYFRRILDMDKRKKLQLSIDEAEAVVDIFFKKSKAYQKFKLDRKEDVAYHWFPEKTMRQIAQFAYDHDYIGDKDVDKAIV